eukprot:14418210-Ditylum_brightwellii.AAC.1
MRYEESEESSISIKDSSYDGTDSSDEDSTGSGATHYNRTNSDGSWVQTMKEFSFVSIDEDASGDEENTKCSVNSDAEFVIMGNQRQLSIMKDARVLKDPN